MKITALRLAQFRRFADPVAIEDFADGINVLAGPNEMGKSTFFHALEAAFTVRHKVTGGVLDAMRPFAGGEPLVEADFEKAGARWRIRKQFGRGNSAILSDVTTGRIVARNAEAEDQLAKLIGNGGDLTGPVGLVWVRQQRALHAPDPDIDHQTGKERLRGERSALQDAIGDEVEAVAGGETLARVQSRVSDALNVLLTPTRNGPRKNGPLDIARRERDDTLKDLQRAEQAAQAAEVRLQAIDVAMREAEALRDPARASERREILQHLEARIAQEAQRRAQFDIAREALQARFVEAKSIRQTLDAARARVQRLADLEAQRSGATELERAIASLVADVNGNAATPQRLERLAALFHTCELADAALAASAATVDVTLQADGVQRVRVDGRALQTAESLSVSETIDIAIDGVAHIRVTAAGAESAANARRKRAAAVLEIGTLLQEIGVSNIDEARVRSAARATAIEALDRSRAILSGVAPHGLTGLSDEISALQNAGKDGGDADAIAAELNQADAAALAARATFDKLKSEILPDDAFRKLSADAASARQAVEAADRTLNDLHLRIEKLKSEQAGADEDGRAGQVDALRGAFQRHDAEVKRLEAEGKALLLLARTLTEIEARQRDALFEPVSRRLQPHLSAVFGAADVAFRDAFAVDGLLRGGQREAFGALSDGTREQISVLVRLSYAELLAARGFAVPLVLDDPLVYSDDERLANMCSVLNAAAQTLQIVVLTCRPTAFQTLSGRRVSMTAWRPDK